jgi:hypothetical protein
MSSITGTPEFKKMQEQYLQRERESEEKNDLKIKDLTVKAHDDLKSLEDRYGNQIEELKKRNREMLTTQDKKYTKEIDELRSMYIKKLENATKE